MYVDDFLSIFTLISSWQAADPKSTSRLATTIMDLCYEAQDYPLLNSNISVLSKKHGQLKAVVQEMVEKAMGWLDEIRQKKGVEKWLELVETLRQVTEGKVSTHISLRFAIIWSFLGQIFLETPRARVTRSLSLYHESQADAADSPEKKQKSIEIASELLSDLQVETYSSMERREKTEFLLEQMRLLVLVARGKDAEDVKEGKDEVNRGEADWLKVRVGGRKVSETFLKEKANQVCLAESLFAFKFLTRFR